MTDSRDATLVSLRERIAQLEKTNHALIEQVRDLGQCVECGELDHQDGNLRGGEFRCVGCGENERAKTLREENAHLLADKELLRKSAQEWKRHAERDTASMDRAMKENARLRGLLKEVAHCAECGEEGGRDWVCLECADD